MHPADLHHISASRIFHAIRRRPHVSQREIADMTGTDKSTVSAVIRNFAAAGLIERTLGRGGQGPGRPGESIAISPHGGLLAGVHPRPEGIRYVVSGLDGEPLHALTRALPTPARLAQEVRAGIAEITAAVGRKPSEVRAVGISIPGLVNRDGVLAQSPNLGWRDVALRHVLARGTHWPLYIDNNANAAAAAEFLFGRGNGASHFAYVESGSGVGAGLFIDGSLYRGTRGFAGEFGHTKVVPQGRPCRCGSLGCLSAYASDYSIIERLRQRGVAAATRADVVAAASGGDATTRAVLHEAGHHLGVGLANLLNLLDIQLFILGGGFAALAPFMRPAIASTLDDLALPAATAGCHIETSDIGSWDRPRGGIALALEGCTSHVRTEATPW